MMYQFLDKKQINKRKKNIKNLIILIVFFVFVFFGFLTLTGRLFNFIGRPIWNTERAIINSWDNINYLLRLKKTIFEDNKNLKEENINLNLSMIDYKILKDENNQLKEIINRIPNVKNFVLGNILTKPNNSPYDTLIIDIGEDLGIKVGDDVYVNGNIPVGIIEKVYSKTSLVSLYTNPGQKTEGFIDGVNASVELIGRGGGNFEMIIPIDLEVNNGTIIYLPGGVSEVLAFVDEIISTPSDPFKKVLLSSPINIQNIKWVEVKNK